MGAGSHLLAGGGYLLGLGINAGNKAPQGGAHLPEAVRQLADFIFGTDVQSLLLQIPGGQHSAIVADYSNRLGDETAYVSYSCSRQNQAQEGNQQDADSQAGQLLVNLVRRGGYHHHPAVSAGKIKRGKYRNMGHAVHKLVGAPHLAAGIRSGFEQGQQPVVQGLFLDLKLRGYLLLRQLQLARQLRHGRMHDNIAAGIGKNAVARLHKRQALHQLHQLVQRKGAGEHTVQLIPVHNGNRHVKCRLACGWGNLQAGYGRLFGFHHSFEEIHIRHAHGGAVRPHSIPVRENENHTLQIPGAFFVIRQHMHHVPQIADVLQTGDGSKILRLDYGLINEALDPVAVILADGQGCIFHTLRKRAVGNEIADTRDQSEGKN
ncbi:hypothetical protein D3C75_605030 [compost metagenome]